MRVLRLSAGRHCRSGKTVSHGLFLESHRPLRRTLETKPNMREIPLTRGQVALVDDADYEWLSGWKWYANRKRDRWYAVRNTASHRFIRMHRAILGLDFGDPRQVDHINNDGLDNRRFNLRITNPHGNNGNVGLRRDNTSGFRGVSWDKTRGRWMACLRMGGHIMHLGRFDTPEAAARAWNEAALAYWGSMARLNPLENPLMTS